MTVWVDAQFSPAIAAWIAANFSIEVRALRDLGLRDAEDEDIFHAARAAKAVIMTKDADFHILLDHYGPPPQILWITCGNTSNYRLKDILTATMPEAITLLAAGERLVEISDA